MERLRENLKGTVLFIAVIGVISFVGWVTFMLFGDVPLALTYWGIRPRTPVGLAGLLTAPFLHGSLFHLLGNMTFLFPFTLLTLTFYRRIAIGVMAGITVGGGGLVWLFADIGEVNGIHIGASGLIFGLFGFLVLGGIFRRNLKLIIVALLLAPFYTGFVFGALPFFVNRNVSWESHLFGLLVGVIIAYLTRHMELETDHGGSG